MVKQVPIQTGLKENLNTGSAVQFNAQQIEPMKDVVTDDLGRASRAFSGAQEVAQRLSDQLNDAEATKLYNEAYSEIEQNQKEYLQKQGLEAVATTTTEKDAEPKNVLDIYRNDNLDKILEKYRNKASNGSVRYMFETKAGVSISDSQDKMTQYSIKQQQIGLTKVLTDQLAITKRQIVDDYEKWAVEGSVYQTRLYVGLALVDEIALLKGLQIDPTKGRVSSQYLEMKRAFILEVSKEVSAKLRKDKKFEQAGKYLNSFNPDKGLLELNKKEHIAHNRSKCVDATIRDNNNTNDGTYLSSANRMLCLASANSHDDGTGSGVNDNHHSKNVDTTEKSQAENIELSEQILNTKSKFYRPDSTLNGALPNQHRTIHMFASQHLGVEKADSFYTKAKSEIDIDPQKYKNDPVYAKNINSQIITNYKKLITEESEKKYKRKDIVDLQNEINKLPRPTWNKGEPRESYRQRVLAWKKKIDEVKAAAADDPKYIDKIVNDLNILEGEIDYDYDPSNETTIEIDPVTNLQPLSVLLQKLEATIQDPKELAIAKKDLQIKYDELKKSRENLYNQSLNTAKTIAFAKEGGWRDLEDNNIDINNFKEEDQEMLKNGHPEKSDTDTLIILDRDPANLGDNLIANLHKISKKDFIELQDYAATLNSKDKVLDVSIETDMLDLTLKEYDLQFIKNGKFDKDDYLQISQTWRKLIDEEQRNTNKKLTRERKKQILEGILTNTVVYDFGVLQGDHEWPIAIVDKKQQKDTYVKVGGRTIWLYEINDFQREKMIEKIKDNGQQVTEQLIAEMWVFGGRSKIDNEEDWRKYNLEKELSSTSSMQ